MQISRPKMPSLFIAHHEARFPPAECPRGFTRLSAHRYSRRNAAGAPLAQERQPCLGRYRCSSYAVEVERENGLLIAAVAASLAAEEPAFTADEDFGLLLSHFPAAPFYP